MYDLLPVVKKNGLIRMTGVSFPLATTYPLMHYEIAPKRGGAVHARKIRDVMKSFQRWPNIPQLRQVLHDDSSLGLSNPLADRMLTHSCSNAKALMLPKKGTDQDKRMNHQNLSFSDSVAIILKPSQNGLEMFMTQEGNSTPLESILLQRKKNYNIFSFYGIYLENQNKFALISNITGNVELFFCKYEKSNNRLHFRQLKNKIFGLFHPVGLEKLKLNHIIEIKGSFYYGQSRITGSNFLLKELYFGEERKPKIIEFHSSLKDNLMKRIVSTQWGEKSLFLACTESLVLPGIVEFFDEEGGTPIGHLALNKLPGEAALDEQHELYFADLRLAQDGITPLCVIWTSSWGGPDRPFEWREQLYEIGKIQFDLNCVGELFSLLPAPLQRPVKRDDLHKGTIKKMKMTEEEGSNG